MTTSGFPMRNAAFTADIDGEDTQFLLVAHSNYIFVLATQTETLGTILQVTYDRVLGSDSVPAVRVLVGRRNEPALEFCGLQLAAAMSAANENRPLLLNLGLKQHTAAAARQIVDCVLDNKVW